MHLCHCLCVLVNVILYKSVCNISLIWTVPTLVQPFNWSVSNSQPALNRLFCFCSRNHPSKEVKVPAILPKSFSYVLHLRHAEDTSRTIVCQYVSPVLVCLSVLLMLLSASLGVPSDDSAVLSVTITHRCTSAHTYRSFVNLHAYFQYVQIMPTRTPSVQVLYSRSRLTVLSNRSLTAQSVEWQQAWQLPSWSLLFLQDCNVTAWHQLTVCMQFTLIVG